MPRKFDYKTAPALREYSTFTGRGESGLDFKTVAKDIPCQAACPVQTNIPGYIEAIAAKNYSRAYAMNLESNVFPGVLGRVCTRPCEDRCRHLWTNTQGPVAICHLKRATADLRDGNPVLPPSSWYPDTGKRVAVVGGGPSGLTAARELKRLGHQVTVYEKNPKPGGMMIYGIPRFRLPDDVVDREINLITDSGVVIKTGEKLDRYKIESLINKNDSVLIAAGTSVSNSMDIEGLTPGLALDGLAFMHRYNTGQIKKMKGKVIIVGGGFTAVDCARGCARAAKRLVGEEGDVSIMYRRSEQYMAADMEEKDEISNEQINIRSLVTPVNATLRDGKLVSVTFIRNMLSRAASGGKPEIKPVPDSDFELPCDHLIIAIGQQQDASLLPEGILQNQDGTTSHPGIFTAGDFQSGSQDIISAIALGKQAALNIDKAIMGAVRLKKVVDVEAVVNEGDTGRVREHDLQIPARMPTVSVLERAIGNTEVEKGFDDKSAEINATRCYFCHYKFEIDQDKCIHCNWCIDVAPRECIYKVSRVFQDGDGAVTNYVEAGLARDATYIFIDSDECIRCGNCLRVCPTEAISMRKAELKQAPCARSKKKK